MVRTGILQCRRNVLQTAGKFPVGNAQRTRAHCVKNAGIIWLLGYIRSLVRLVVQGAQMHLYNSPLSVVSCFELVYCSCNADFGYCVEQGRPRPLYIV
uniref:Uncharacterized protein n=1 Tax=Physcomitrium patens TaxID=3218 RepID=A0A7I3Z164_PHYPA